MKLVSTVRHINIINLVTLVTGLIGRVSYLLDGLLFWFDYRASVFIYPDMSSYLRLSTFVSRTYAFFLLHYNSKVRHNFMMRLQPRPSSFAHKRTFVCQSTRKLVRGATKVFLIQIIFGATDLHLIFYIFNYIFLATVLQLRWQSCSVMLHQLFSILAYKKRKFTCKEEVLDLIY